jgi:3-isopropylmalate/(R)-2-methylmalate dehydratase small subunit
MEPYTKITGLVAPLDRANVDTDAIIPKQFLKAVVRSGLGKGLFYDWRRRADSSEDPNFVLNDSRFRGATILVARANFGCGSSREHAVWALEDGGFRTIIAPSFADIFYNNALKNGVLPLILPNDKVSDIFAAIERYQGYRLTVDLPNQRVSDEFGWSANFTIGEFQKKCLVEGLDDIALTLLHEREIAAYEASHPAPYPR